MAGPTTMGRIRSVSWVWPSVLGRPVTMDSFSSSGRSFVERIRLRRLRRRVLASVGVQVVFRVWPGLSFGDERSGG